MLDLNNVTLVTIDGVGNTPDALKALKYSCNSIKYGEVLYFSTKNWSNNNFYKFVEIPKLTYDEYNKFCLVTLCDYIETDYVLIVQDDGFVVNPNKWSKNYLNYDYIGAPWPKEHLFFNTKRWPIVHNKLCESDVKYHIGNGGFTLRSKKLLNSIKNLYSSEHKDIPEDVLICIAFRKLLENKGFIFAPYDIAKTFSCESIFVENEYHDPNNTFGFHGRETHKQYIKLLNSLELKE